MDSMAELTAAPTSSRRKGGRAAPRHERTDALGRHSDSGSSLPADAGVALHSRSVELAQVLDRAAHRLAEKGTFADRHLLEAMSRVAAPSAPGAAAALVDPHGTEIARLRAFGLVHAHLLGALGPLEHARLLDLLDGAAAERARSAGPA